MDIVNIANVNGVELKYEVSGSGEPVLLISALLPGTFRPFMAAGPLQGRYRLIHYDKRGWGGSTHTAPPVTIADHAADAAALLERLGIERAHVAGHSSGGSIALQLACDRPDLVHSLALLEPSLFTVPSAENLFAHAGPAVRAYGDGDHATAVAGFLAVVSGLPWDDCRATIEHQVPGAVADAIDDADTFFGVELPALSAWTFAREHAATISQPVLSVRGSQTERLWVEVAELLRSWLPQLEELTVDGVGHLLQIQEPEAVVAGVAAFFGRHAMNHR